MIVTALKKKNEKLNILLKYSTSTFKSKIFQMKKF